VLHRRNYFPGRDPGDTENAPTHYSAAVRHADDGNQAALTDIGKFTERAM
jgi:hypothetical protein